MLIPYLLIIFSLAGIGFIVFKKIPLLVKLPAEPEAVLPRQSLKEKLFNQLKEVSRLNYWLIFLNWLEKTLKKIRILFLKLDNLVILLIAKLREISHNFTIKSKAWMSEKRMRRIEKLRLLADLKRTKEEKEEIFLRIIRQNPKDIKAYKELGNLYLEDKNYQDAKSAFEEVLKINPEEEIAKEKLEELNKII